MLSLWKTIQSIVCREGRTSSRYSPPLKRRLSVEVLERRDLLATLLWTSGSPTNILWSDQDNWIDINTKQVTAPQAGDDLLFSPSTIVMIPVGKTGQEAALSGSDSDSRDDLNLQFGSLTLNTTGKVWLEQNLRITGGLFNTAQIRSSGAQRTVTVDPGVNQTSTLTLNNSGSLADVVFGTGLTTNTAMLNGTSIVGKLTNSGVINWKGDTLSLGDTLTNTATGIINSEKDGKLADFFGMGFAPFVNQGTFKKTGAGGGILGETQIELPFENRGTFLISTGTVNLTRGGTQTTINAVTQMEPATTLMATTFTVSAGGMYAQGDFYGQLVNSAYLHLGWTNGVAGQLTVHGTYNQGGQNALLDVEITPVGTSRLVVTTHLNLSGSATVNGTIRLARAFAWAPPVGSTIFVSAVSLSGNGVWMSAIPNDTWVAGGVWVSFRAVRILNQDAIFDIW